MSLSNTYNNNATANSANSQQFASKLVPMSAYQVYLSQVAGTINTLRMANTDPTVTYIPPQYGGPYGQQALIEQTAVLQVITFNVP